MADYFQNGSITTLQNITRRPVEEIENELRLFAQLRNMVLLLPAQDVEVKPGAQWSQVRLPGKSQPLGYVRNDRIQRQR